MSKRQAATLAFGVETQADLAGGRLLFDLDNLDAAATLSAMQQIAVQTTGRQTLPPHLRRVVAIGVAGWVEDRFIVAQLDRSDGEQSLLKDLRRRLADPNTQMLCYDGARVQAVLHCRALCNGMAWTPTQPLDIGAPLSTSDGVRPPLDELMQLQGLPAVAEETDAQALSEMRAVQTFLLHTRSRPQCFESNLEQRVAQYLCEQEASHWTDFMTRWRSNTEVANKRYRDSNPRSPVA